jgi:hypothetical protein
MKNKKLIIALTLLSINASVINANNKQLTFSTKINTVCGIEINDTVGSIEFNDKVSTDSASFKVKTNSNQGYSKVSFSNINKSDNIQNENGIFKINNTIDIDWNSPQEINIDHNKEQIVIAKINKNSNEIIAGEASISTILEIECVEQ